MKHTFLIFALLMACSSKPSQEQQSSADTTKAIVKDTIPVKAVDTVAVQSVKPVEPVVAEVKPENKGPQTKLCKYKGLDSEACVTYRFDCLTTKDVDTRMLPKAQADLFNKLMVIPANGEGDFPVANPAYIGKTFEVAYTTKEGNLCDATGKVVKGPVVNLLVFKLK